MFQHNRPEKPRAVRKMKKIDNVVPLQVRQLPFYRVHYLTLNAYVQSVFGFEFDFLFAAGVTENTLVDFEVSGLMLSDAWERKANDLRQCKRTKDTALILNVLAHDGYIQPGRYTISTRTLPDPTDVYRSLLQKTGNPLSPECMAFREKHKDNKVFMERATILAKCFEPAP